MNQTRRGFIERAIAALLALIGIRLRERAVTGTYYMVLRDKRGDIVTRTSRDDGATWSAAETIESKGGQQFEAGNAHMMFVPDKDVA